MCALAGLTSSEKTRTLPSNIVNPYLGGILLTWAVRAILALKLGFSGTTTGMSALAVSS